MPLPEFTLHDYNKIASGEYNAGQIDFATGDNGRVSLAKINNHVHKRGLNKTTLSAERILEVKEAFVSALRRCGVSDADIVAIRTRLGIPAEMKATSTREAQEDILRKRFVPLSRNDVRAILDEYANNGRGFGAGRRANVSWEELHAASKTAHRSRSAVEKSERTNAESLANNRAKIDFTFTHALVALKLDKSLGAIDAARKRLVKGPDAENAKSSSSMGLRNQFASFFGQALRMMDPGVHESAEFDLCGQTAKLVKGEDGSIAAVVGKGELATKVPLKGSAESLLVEIIGRAIADRDFLGADRVRAMLDRVFARDVEGFLTAEDRTSLTRQFAAMLLYVRTDGDAGYGAILNGNYNTETLVEVANQALDGKVVTKADLDRFYNDLAQDNAGLDDEMKAMMARVAGLPIAPRRVGENGKPIKTLVVQKQIVGDLNQIVLTGSLHKALPGHEALMADTKRIVRARLGETGLPEATPPGSEVLSGVLDNVIDPMTGNNTVRLTRATLREAYLQAAIATAARRVLLAAVEKEIEALHGNTGEASAVRNALVTRYPDYLRALVEAKSPAEAEQVNERFRGVVRDLIKTLGAAQAAHAGVVDRAHRGLAGRLGISPEAVAAGRINRKQLEKNATSLMNSILNGTAGISSKEDCEKAFGDVADAFVAERVDRFAEVDALDDLPQATKDAIKTQLVGFDKVKGIDPGLLLDEARKIDTSRLESLLRDGAPADQVYAEMDAITLKIEKPIRARLALTQKEIGPDDVNPPRSVVTVMLAGLHPDLGGLVDGFFARPDVKDEVLGEDYEQFRKSGSFNVLSNDPQIHMESDLALDTLRMQNFFVAPRNAVAGH